MPCTDLAVEQPALLYNRQVFRQHTLFRVKCKLTVRTFGAVHSAQKLPYRLLIFDNFLDFARSEVELVSKLRQLTFD